MYFTVIAINLVSPNGLVILKIGSFPITKDSLLKGIEKSSLLTGILYLSKNISLTKIKIPGNLGIIIRDTFHYFSQLTGGDRIRPQNLIEDLDNKLLELKPFSSSDSLIKPLAGSSKMVLPVCTIVTITMFTIDNILLST